VARLEGPKQLKVRPAVPAREATASPSTVAKVSHTLEIGLAERLREFAFRERISESAVIEFALHRFFLSARDGALGVTLREGGAGKRRKAT
jgi:hypothetical protein